MLVRNWETGIWRMGLGNSAAGNGSSGRVLDLLGLVSARMGDIVGKGNANYPDGHRGLTSCRSGQISCLHSPKQIAFRISRWILFQFCDSFSGTGRLAILEFHAGG